MSQKRYGEIMRKVEDALADHIAACPTELITGVPVVKGFQLDDLPSERIEIEATEAVPEIVGSTVLGNWTVSLMIKYAYNYKDVTRSAAQAKASELFDLFLVPDINNQLNKHSKVPDFAVYGGSPNEGESMGTGFEPGAVKSIVEDAHTFSVSMSATIYCRPSGLEV